MLGQLGPELYVSLLADGDELCGVVGVLRAPANLGVFEPPDFLALPMA